MIGQMAIAIAFPGSNDLGRTVTPVFLLMDHFFYQFSSFSEKIKKKTTRSQNFVQNARSNSVHLALRSSVRRFQMPFEGLRFVKTWVKFGIIYATDPLLQNKTKIVCLR